MQFSVAELERGRICSCETTLETILEEDSDCESPLNAVADRPIPDNDPFLTSASRNMTRKIDSVSDSVVVTLSKYADSNLIQALKKKYCSPRAEPSTTLPLLTHEAQIRKVRFLYFFRRSFIS